MLTHFLALVSAIIITEWLLVAGWMREDRQYFLWAALVIIGWWLATLRNNPPWPSPRDIHIRILIYGNFFAITLLFSLMVSTWSAYLVAFTIPLLLVLEMVWKMRRNP